MVTKTKKLKDMTMPLIKQILEGSKTSPTEIRITYKSGSQYTFTKHKDNDNYEGICKEIT